MIALCIFKQDPFRLVNTFSAQVEELDSSMRDAIAKGTDPVVAYALYIRGSVLQPSSYTQRNAMISILVLSPSSDSWLPPSVKGFIVPMGPLLSAVALDFAAAFAVDEAKALVADIWDVLRSCTSDVSSTEMFG